MHVKKDQNVTILTGKDKGKSGKILRALPKENKVVVEGVNIRKARVRSNKMGAKTEFVERPYPIDASNVRLAK